MRSPARARLPLVAALGAVGSCLAAWVSWPGGEPGSPVDWWLKGVPVLDWLAAPPDAIPRVVLAQSGVLALVVAWFLLRRLSLAGALSVRAVVVVAVVWAAPLLVAPPYWSGDAFMYLAQGRLAERGLDPGEHPPSALGDDEVLRQIGPGWLDDVTAYGPAATLLSEAAARTGGDRIEAGVLLWRLWALGGVALLGVGVAVLARSYGADVADALVLAVAGPLTVLHLVGGVHNDAVMVGLLACGLAVAARRQSWSALLAAAALCGLATAVKVPAVIAVVYIGWTGGKPPLVPGRISRAAVPDQLVERCLRTIAVLAVALATVAAVSLVAGAGWGWLGSLGVSESIISVLSISTTIGLLLARLTGAPLVVESTIVRVTRSAFTFASVAIAAALLFLSPTLGPAGLAGAFAAVGLLGISVVPWYLTWPLAPAAVVLAGRRVWWPMVVAAVGVLAEGANLALRPARLVTVVAVAVVATLAWRVWTRHAGGAGPQGTVVADAAGPDGPPLGRAVDS